jgi:CRISPR-associated protein Csd1
MILKALYDYYNRSGNLAPVGWEKKEIAFLIVIDKEGRFLRLEDRRIDKKSSQTFIVPKGVGRSSGVRSNLLWDNTDYILGVSLKKSFKEDRVRQCHEAFVKFCNVVHNKHNDDEGLAAVCKFYKSEEEKKVLTDPLWSEVKETHNLSFLLNGSLNIIAENKILNSDIVELSDVADDANYRICIITGNESQPVETTTRTPIPGSQASAKLVAFQVNSGYDSWGNSKGANAPISQEAEFAYTTALNKLLSKDSHNKFLEGNRTFLFWASNANVASHQAEEGLFALLGKSDDPVQNVEKVKEVFKAIFSGAIKTTTEDRFYFLCLAPNSARIAVVYWNECLLKDFAENILLHFSDMEIADTRKEKKPYCGLYSILSAVTQSGKASDVQPNLPEAVMKSIVQGIPYPFSLYAACLRRIMAEQDVRITRAAIIKAYINRKSNNKLTIMVDKENSNPGYLAGRLFATLEYEQKGANGTANIIGKYITSASSTPASVFPTLLSLSFHHEEKLRGDKDKAWIAIKGDKVKEEIIGKIEASGLPAKLTLEDQGRFMVGYYHQRCDFYTKNEEKQNNE